MDATTAFGHHASTILDVIVPIGLSAADQASVVHGACLARAGDCVACHTAGAAAKGIPFAGGLPIKSPLGTIYSTNNTPDPDAGIGKYTEAQFGASLIEGKRADGSNLYPSHALPVV